MRLTRMAACVALAAGSLWCQQTNSGFIRGSTGGGGPTGSWGSAQIAPPPFPPPVVIGAPYSGEEKLRAVQIMADGTRITRDMGGSTIYRDSEGRVRIERTLFTISAPVPGSKAPAPKPIQIVEINDPVAGVYHLLDPEKKIAYRLKYTPAQPPSNAGKQAPGRPPTPTGTNQQGVQFTTEELGMRSIHGVQAEGRKTTTIVPEGVRGNDRPMTQVAEEWYSNHLRRAVQRTSKDASSENFFELSNISLASPSPVLFSAPSEYAIQERTEAFTAEFGQRPAGITGSASRISVQVPVPASPRAGKQ